MNQSGETEPVALDVDLIRKLREIGDRNANAEYLAVLNEALTKVVTIDNEEPLVPLNIETLGSRTFVDLVGLGVDSNETERLQLREGVVARLKRAADSLPSGYSLLIRDAFRTEAMVWNLYALYIERLKEREPTLTDAERDLRVRNLLAMPDDPVPPGHMTGGAVDAVLGDAKGNRLQLEVSEEQIPRIDQAVTFYPRLPAEILKKRSILFGALTGQGFNNYFREYWHFSYGDAYWAVRRRDKTAVYGIPREIG